MKLMLPSAPREIKASASFLMAWLLLPAYMKLWEAVSLACKQGKISDPSLFLIKLPLPHRPVYCCRCFVRHRCPILTLHTFRNSIYEQYINRCSRDKDVHFHFEEFNLFAYLIGKSLRNTTLCLKISYFTHRSIGDLHSINPCYLINIKYYNYMLKFI